MRVLSAVFAGAVVSSGAAHAFSLQEAYEAALQNDPQYQMARKEREAGQQNEKMGLAGLLPQISYNYSTTHNIADYSNYTYKTTSLLNYQSLNNTVSLRQTLFNMDAWARYQQGIAQSEYAEAVFNVRGNELIQRVSEAYTNALYARDQLRLIQAQRDALYEQMQMNKRLFERGEGTRTDMLETQARYETAEAQILEARDAVDNTERILLALVGEGLIQSVQSLNPLTDRFVLMPLVPGDFEAWKEFALQNNNELQAQRKSVEYARQDLKRNQAGHYPRLDLVTSYGRSESESINTVNSAYLTKSVGFQLSVPIFSGGYVNAATAQSLANYERAQAELQNKTNNILVELRKQFNTLESSSKKIAALEKAVASAKELVIATRKSVLGGVRVNLDVLQAEQQLMQTQRDLAQARYTYILADLRLRGAAGMLLPEDVQRSAGYFEKN